MIPYKTDTEISSYIIFPRFLIPLDLSNDAKVLYALLLDRAGISRKKGYIEADGTIRNFAEAGRWQHGCFMNWNPAV